MTMLKKIKKLSASATAILLILVGVGGFTLARTVRKELLQVMASDGSKVAAAETALRNFSADFEQLVPHERRMNTLLYYATGIFNSNHVIWGKEDWLFYSSKNSGDPIADYEGTNSFSDEELEEAKNNMLHQQNILAERGIGFCLMIPPNKENVYARYMPDKFVQAERSRTDILTEHLVENGINCINPKEALLNSDEKYRTYYKQDTHWNELGAYIGTKEALEVFGIGLPPLSKSEIEESESAAADLADMVGLESVFPKDYGFRMAWTARDRENVTKEVNGPMTYWHNDNAPVEGRLLLIGDSFRTAMIMLLSSTFEDFYVVHRTDYQPQMLEEAAPDYVILEIVERHSEYTMDFSIE